MQERRGHLVIEYETPGWRFWQEWHRMRRKEQQEHVVLKSKEQWMLIKSINFQSTGEAPSGNVCFLLYDYSSAQQHIGPEDSLVVTRTPSLWRGYETVSWKLPLQTDKSIVLFDSFDDLLEFSYDEVANQLERLQSKRICAVASCFRISNRRFATLALKLFDFFYIDKSLPQSYLLAPRESPKRRVTIKRGSASQVCIFWNKKQRLSVSACPHAVVHARATQLIVSEVEIATASSCSICRTRANYAPTILYR